MSTPEDLAATVADLARRVEALEGKVEKLLGVYKETIEKAFGIIEQQAVYARELREDMGAMLSRGTSAGVLLSYYEQRVQPTGQPLREWLREIKAEDRYRAIVALRSRRKKSQS